MILIMLPDSDYDPTETSIPWQALVKAGYNLSFATPSGKVAHADRYLTDIGFGILSPFFMTRKKDLETYRMMTQSPAFLNPLKIENVDFDSVDAILVPGGHAQGMKTLLESAPAKDLVSRAFSQNLPIAAICHGVLLLARSINKSTGVSVLYDRKTTALPKWMELFAWFCTRHKLGNYYRTYPMTVEDEVKANMHHDYNFHRGPFLPYRDNPKSGGPVCVVRDRNYLSARWPGDAHTFAKAFVSMLEESDRASATAGLSTGYA